MPLTFILKFDLIDFIRSRLIVEGMDKSKMIGQRYEIRVPVECETPPCFEMSV